jgi:hypothetical protein
LQHEEIAPITAVRTQTVFYFKPARSAYFSPLWEQVRELAYLTISEKAMEFAEIGPNSSLNPRKMGKFQIVHLKALEASRERLGSTTTVETFLAAVSGASVLLPSVSANEMDGKPTLDFAHDNSAQVRAYLWPR